MNRTPTPRSWIRQVAARIAARVKPLKIILFGSYAYGRPTKDSDLDILVVLGRRPGDRFAGYMRVQRAVGEHVWPLDLLVKGKDEIESRLAIGDSFIMEVLKKGKVLFEAPSS